MPECLKFGKYGSKGTVKYKKLGSEMESVMFMYSWKGRLFGVLWLSLDNDAGIRLIVEALKRFGLQLLGGVLTQTHGESCALGRSSKEWLISCLAQREHKCRQSLWT